MKLAQFALSRRVPEYVPRTAGIRALAVQPNEEVLQALKAVGQSADALKNTHIGSVIFACRPGDGSAREQAASCQRVLGGAANICYAFATKRYRSNCINWGMLPLTTDEGAGFDYEPGDWVWIPNVRERIAAGEDDLPAVLLGRSGVERRVLHLNGLTEDEREILLAGCLMNFNKEKGRKA
jgi:aconitate hydratase